MSLFLIAVIIVIGVVCFGFWASETAIQEITDEKNKNSTREALNVLQLRINGKRAILSSTESSIKELLSLQKETGKSYFQEILALREKKAIVLKEIEDFDSQVSNLTAL